jgi:serine/threonine protein kinase
MLPEPEPARIGLGSVVDDFEIMEQIGAGGFSRVHFAKHLPTSNFCAAKIVDLSSVESSALSGMMREVSVFMQVNHPNVCNLYRLSVHNEELVFFIEYAARGTLLELVNRRNGLNEFEAQRLFSQLFAAVRHLHIYHFLVHRDLKLENVLLDQKGNVKLTDFGLSGTYYDNVMHTFVGTGGYQAPEILAGSEYDEKCDIWSLGVCLWAMVSGGLPFSTQNHSARMLVQEVGELVYPRSFSPLLTDLIRRMFAVKPHERPTLLQLQGHPWLKDLQQLGTNVAPQPIIFYRVPNIQGILKFKRRPVKADPKLIEKCAAMGLNVKLLAEQLRTGQTSELTASYFFCMYPLAQKPEIVHDEAPKRIIPGARKRAIEEATAPESMIRIAKRFSATIGTKGPVVILPLPGSRGSIVKPAPHNALPMGKRPGKPGLPSPRKLENTPIKLRV